MLGASTVRESEAADKVGEVRRDQTAKVLVSRISKFRHFLEVINHLKQRNDAVRSVL